MARKKKEVKEPTREELIAGALTKAKTFNEVRLDIDVPDNRKLYPGDKVEIGNLKDCVVIETTPDFKYIIVEYTNVEHNYGNPIVTPGDIGGWNWLDAVRLDTISPGNNATKRTVAVHMINTDLRGLLHSAIHRGLIDNPDYQRGYVWTYEDKHNYLRSVFEDRDLGKFIFVEDRSYSEYRLEVLDGKQRMSALLEFYTSQLPYNGKYYHNLSKHDRYLIEGRMVQFAQIDKAQYSKADLLSLFLDLNTAGVPQTEEHLDHVRELLRKEKANDATK